jgi:GT2 family glycosyltransferase
MIMKITVILCTYNRCRSLPKALESVAAQTFSKSVEWEVLVVDNNSPRSDARSSRGVQSPAPGSLSLPA